MENETNSLLKRSHSLYIRSMLHSIIFFYSFISKNGIFTIICELYINCIRSDSNLIGYNKLNVKLLIYLYYNEDWTVQPNFLLFSIKFQKSKWIYFINIKSNNSSSEIIYDWCNFENLEYFSERRTHQWLIARKNRTNLSSLYKNLIISTVFFS